MMSDKTMGITGHDQCDRVMPIAGGQGWRNVAVAGPELAGAALKMLCDVGMRHTTLVHHHWNATPPHPYELLRIEEMDGSPLNSSRIGRRWHRPPYAFPLRLARYAPLSAEPEALDFAVIGTRGTRSEFCERVEGIAARLVEDAIVGASRGHAGLSLDTDELRSRHRCRSAAVDHTIAKWHTRLFSEWWSVGMTATPLTDIVRTGATGRVQWLSPDRGNAYLADPFPWPGTNMLLCEEMPFSGGNGRIVALAPDWDGLLRHSTVVLETGDHHSYPCAIKDGESIYFLPEATKRGATTLYRLMPGKDEPTPLCAVAPGRRLADPTLFRDADHYWIACTDLDIGTHDNLCLLHAREPTGPWQPHRCTPVKIDICGARPAGPLFRLGSELFRPGQDCARTYGAAVVIHRVEELSPEHYRETVVTRVLPDPRGPFPHGLHTLAAGQEGVWLDGKRFVFDPAGLLRKTMRVAKRAADRVRSPQK
jgi:hypothetical protein